MKWAPLLFVFACRTPAPAPSPATPPPPASAPAPCPATGETVADCPWAAVGRDATHDGDARDVLQRRAPDVVAQLARDAQAPAMLAIWGAALNYNQEPGGGFSADPIVAPAIVDALTALAGATPRRDRVVHAGVQHTYGYLFSVLATPYGFKRARWVQPAVNDGFGLPAGTIAPVPVAGTLLGNLSWLAGSIAFAGEPERAAARSAPALVSPAVQALDPAALHVVRLTDTVDVAGRSVELRTDFVELPHPTDATAALLIYSIRDRGASRLVTAFPISAASRDKYEAAPLGDNQPITTQYNAWVDGLTGSKLPGRRARR